MFTNSIIILFNDIMWPTRKKEAKHRHADGGGIVVLSPLSLSREKANNVPPSPTTTPKMANTSRRRQQQRKLPSSNVSVKAILLTTYAFFAISEIYLFWIAPDLGDRVVESIPQPILDAASSIASVGDISIIPTISTWYNLSHDIDLPKKIDNSWKNISTITNFSKDSEDTNEDWTEDTLSDPAANDHNFVEMSHEECTAPEWILPWPLDKSGFLHLSAAVKAAKMRGDDTFTEENAKLPGHLTCTLTHQSPFTWYLKETLWKSMLEPILRNDQCRKLVVFSVAFTDKDWDALQHRYPKESQTTTTTTTDSSCFFIFTTDEYIPWDVSNTKMGQHLVLPIPRRVLPYSSSTRNAKLIKYFLPLILQHYRYINTDYSYRIDHVIWQDNNFYVKDGWYTGLPKDYYAILDRINNSQPRYGPCLSGIALPDSLGPNVTISERFREFCRVLQKDTTSFDLPAITGLMQQCEAYAQYAAGNETIVINEALIDTSFLIWNESTQKCRDFNTKLRCHVMKQIHCHTDIDRISLPFALQQMELEKAFDQEDDREWNPQVNDLELLHRETSDAVVKVIRRNCHWEKNKIGSGCKFWKDSRKNNRRPKRALINASTSNKTPRRVCTSPEYDVPWPLEGDATSVTSNATCGFKSSSPTSMYFRDTLRNKILDDLTKACRRLVVYGVAFGDAFVNDFLTTMDNSNHSQKLLETHNRCFFMFTTEDNMPDNSNATSPTFLGHFWLIPIPKWTLPYASLRRNAKMVKYMGNLLFQNVKTIVWQDAKFFSTHLRQSQPLSYVDLIHTDSCMTAVGLPIHPWTIGKDMLAKNESLYNRHCETVQSALDKRPYVTDSAESIRRQCRLYENDVRYTKGNIDPLDHGMIDTAFIIWNEANSRCRNFNAAVRCSVMDEMACHSDRDQMSISYIFHKLGLQATYKGTLVNENWNRQINELELIADKSLFFEEELDAITPVKIVRSNCHWYKNPIGSGCQYWKSVKESLPALPFDLSGNTKQVVNFNECTSPETVKWPLEGNIFSKTTSQTCGLKKNNPFSNYLRDTLRNKVLKLLVQECDLVVYGVAFGKDFVSQFNSTIYNSKSQELLKSHGKCFFMFTTQEDMPNQQNTPILYGHFWLVPLPKWAFPYTNPRRNAKLLKYMGYLVFHENVNAIIWQDAKFFRYDMNWKQPTNYLALIQSDTCVTTIGLPVHSNTVGEDNPAAIRGLSRMKDKYKAHCNTIIEAIVRRPNITDSIDTLSRQCIGYVQHVEQLETDHSTERLDQGLIDSAFIIWNESTDTCRQFNAELRCTITSEMHCHSDRDQVSIPFVLYQMGLKGYYGTDNKAVDNDWDPRIQDLDFGLPHDGQSTPTTVFRIARGNCHWYKNPIGSGCQFWDRHSSRR